MAKAANAFRTISEVATTLDTPTHVLRFWESKFSQIKPVKRAGGRRYYRPEDIHLLAGIKTLLHEQGMTIKGAQKLLRENGVKHVIALGQDAAPAQDTAPPVSVVETAPEKTTARPAIMAAIAAAKTTSMRANAAQIAPLIQELAQLRDRIRQSA